jgi:hypothetical protein
VTARRTAEPPVIVALLLAGLLTGCGWYFRDLAGNHPDLPDYRVAHAEHLMSLDAVERAPGDPARLTSRHRVTVLDVTRLDDPPATAPRLHQPLGELIGVTIEIAEDEEVTNQRLLLPHALLPVADGRRFSSDDCRSPAADEARQAMRSHGHVELTLCVDLPPALLDEVTSVELVDPTHPGYEDRHSPTPVLRWDLPHRLPR